MGSKGPATGMRLGRSQVPERPGYQSISLPLEELGHQPLCADKDSTGEKQNRDPFLAQKYKAILNHN